MKAISSIPFVTHILLLCSHSICVAQTSFYQDVFYGGVAGGGGNTTIGAGTFYFDMDIPLGSTIKKAYLIAGRIGNPEDIIITMNGVNCHLDESSIATTGFIHDYLVSSPSSVNYIDVTENINPNVTEYAIEVFPQEQFENQYYSPFYLVIVYENLSLPKTAISIILNHSDVSSHISYPIQNINPVSTLFDIGFSFVGNFFCDIIEDGSYVHVNGNNLGLVGGEDANSTWFCSGTQGHFSYRNNTLFDSGDDTADAFMNGSDALANIRDYVDHNDTSVDIDFIYQTPDWHEGRLSNPIVAAFLSYSSPCEVFDASISENITVCKGQQQQLQATGGNVYAWQPQVDLSCYDCPNPVFTGDTSRFYTCRIWNTDSCSKVLPVKVNVLPNPAMPAFTTTSTECYGNTGEIAINNPPAGFTYSLNDSQPQTLPLFEDLQHGYHLLTAIDTNGCESDTSVYIGEVNSTIAQFSVSPQSGDVPLEVTLTNQSQHATNYVWYIGGDTIHTTSIAPFTHTFHSEGNFDIALVAYHTTEECGDTSYKSVLSEFPFTVIVPTLYGGYADGSPYRIYTSGLSSLQFKLYSDDGRLIHVAELTPSAGHITLWESTDIAAGLYVYHIRAIAEDGTEKMITGKLVVL